jgi:hypothetical protein
MKADTRCILSLKYKSNHLARASYMLVSLCPSICGSTVLVDLGRFVSFLILYTVVGLFGWGINPLQGRYLHTEQHKHRINAHTSMPRVGFEPTIPVLKRAKTVHALDRMAIAILVG